MNISIFRELFRITWFSWTAMLLAVFGAKSIPNSSGIGRELENRSNFKILKYLTLILGVVDCDPCSGFPGELVVHVVALEDVNPVKKKYKRFVCCLVCMRVVHLLNSTWSRNISSTSPFPEPVTVTLATFEEKELSRKKALKILPLQCFRWSWT